MCHLLIRVHGMGMTRGSYKNLAGLSRDGHVEMEYHFKGRFFGGQALHGKWETPKCR